MPCTQAGEGLPAPPTPGLSEQGAAPLRAGLVRQACPERSRRAHPEGARWHHPDGRWCASRGSGGEPPRKNGWGGRVGQSEHRPGQPRIAGCPNSPALPAEKERGWAWFDKLTTNGVGSPRTGRACPAPRLGTGCHHGRWLPPQLLTPRLPPAGPPGPALGWWGGTQARPCRSPRTPEPWRARPRAKLASPAPAGRRDARHSS